VSVECCVSCVKDGFAPLLFAVLISEFEVPVAVHIVSPRGVGKTMGPAGEARCQCECPSQGQEWRVNPISGRFASDATLR
jgi:hypothetical protein